MATPQKRKTQKSGRKLSRKNAEKRKRVTIKGNAIIKKNWDKKQTLHQNYARLGLLTRLNGVAGGKEKLLPDPKPDGSSSASAMDMEERELTEEDVEKLKKTLKPGEGLIQRDDEGNIIRVIVGEKKTHDEILDEEVEPVPAKTEVVRQLEEMAKNGVRRERHQTVYERSWVAKLVEKHGDDYNAMFWDSELNPYQMTAAQLRKKCLQYHKESQQMAAN